MAKLIETLSVQRTEILQALGQHLAISLISLVIAILIAVPLAISLRESDTLSVINIPNSKSGDIQDQRSLLQIHLRDVA